MLLDWNNGDSPYSSVFESGPQLDWEPFESPDSSQALVPLLLPPELAGQLAWADTITRDGEPIWQETPMPLPQLTLTRLTSPDGDAVFQYASGQYSTCYSRPPNHL